LCSCLIENSLLLKTQYNLPSKNEGN
jgi:hypothetical protein